MAKEIAMPETLAEMPFPQNGLNLIREFESQPPGTTVIGTNVRAYEPLTQRNRGGARSGLVQYIQEQVLDAPTVIQHLNIIVDPTTDALLIDDPTDPDSIADPSTNNHSLRNPPPARRVRRGGSARQPNRNKKKKRPSIVQVTPNMGDPAGGDTVNIKGTNMNGGLLGETFSFGPNAASLVSINADGTRAVVTSPAGTGTVDVTVTVPLDANGSGGTSAVNPNDQFTYNTSIFSLVQQAFPSGSSYVFSSDVTAGDLIVFVMDMQNAAPGTARPTVNVSDTQGNVYTQAGSYVYADYNLLGNIGTFAASLWWTIAGASGPLTINYAIAGGTSGPGGALPGQYTKGSPCVAPFESVSSNSVSDGASGTIAVTTNTITVSGPSRLLIFVYNGSWALMNQLPASLNPVSASTPITADGFGANTTAGNQNSYVAIGASFKPM